MSLSMNLSMSLLQTHTAMVGSVLKKSERYIQSHKLKPIFKTRLPSVVVDLRLRSMMDAVLYHFIPTFEDEIYDYYMGYGYSMVDMYDAEEITHIDNFLLEILQSYEA